MTENMYDAVIVGARCAGSPTAMLLARKGHRVLLVDRATFPSDTLSTHLIHPAGASALARWGLLDRVEASGAPLIRRYTFDFGPITISGRPQAVDGVDKALSPRRTKLDKLLLDAASDAGAEVREGFFVDELVVEDGTVVGVRGRGEGGAPVTERARVVVGADGRNSQVAKLAGADRYNERPRLLSWYYSYWSGLPVEGVEIIQRGDKGWAVWPTNDDLSLVAIAWSYAQFEQNRGDIEGSVQEAFDREPPFADRVRAATREDRFFGGAIPNFFRKPYGPGWALVGDAGYTKDPITAQGIGDAFRDAERCAEALDQSLGGARPFNDAMSDYHRMRDEHVAAMYEFTVDFASIEAEPPPDMQMLLEAMQGNQDAMNGFISAYTGSISPADFMSEENLGSIFAAAESGTS
ncbi:MAG: NAD(P)/FAD-dependent oxidoreductase [Actinomycetota bacterium]